MSSRFFDLLNSIIYDLKISLDQRWLFDPGLHSSLDDLVMWKAATSQKHFIPTRFVTFVTYSTSVVHIDTGSHIEDTHRQQTHTGSMGLGQIMIITFLAQCESAGNWPALVWAHVEPICRNVVAIITWIQPELSTHIVNSYQGVRYRCSEYVQIRYTIIELTACDQLVLELQWSQQMNNCPAFRGLSLIK